MTSGAALSPEERRARLAHLLKQKAENLGYTISEQTKGKEKILVLVRR